MSHKTYELDEGLASQIRGSLKETELTLSKMDTLREREVRLKIERDNWIREFLWKCKVEYKEDENWSLKEEGGVMTLHLGVQDPNSNLKIV